MAERLLERIWFTCRHQFSWPRRSADGGYYQVCLECGVKYRYDWSAMQRTGRMEQEVRPVEIDAPRPHRKCSGQPSQSSKAKNGKDSTWRPRERRLHFETPVLYREKNGVEWQHGRTENISRSGLFFEAKPPLSVGTSLEIILEMPAEISGSAGAKVVCQATVARIVKGNEDHIRVAAAISDYQFLPEGQVSGL